MPATPAEQMALAPQVYRFNQQLSRGRNPLDQAVEAVGSTIDTIGRTALGLGLVAGAGFLTGKGMRAYADRRKQEQASAPISTAPSTASTAEQPIEIPATWERRNLPEAEFLEKAPATDVGTEEHLVAQAIEHFEGGGKGVSPFQASMDELRRQTREAALLEKQEAAYAKSPSPIDFLVAKIRKGSDGADKLMLDDEPQVDNDVVAAEPLSTVGKVSGDVTSADPASDINQRVLPRQTSDFVEAKAVAPQPTTIAENLSTQQSPVHKAGELLRSTATRVGAGLQAAQEAASLGAKALAHLPAAERARLLLGGTPSAPVTSEPIPGTQTSTARGPVKTASVSSNPYLSAMSREQGPTQTFEIDPKRSHAISEMAFYPGGELGIKLKNKLGSKEYVYGMADPYREAVGQYASEGFPSGMGMIGRIATPKGVAVMSRAQKQISPGGVLVQGPLPAMPAMAEDTEAVRSALESRAASRPASTEPFERTKIGETPAGAFLKKKAIETIGQIAQSAV